jgi:uncharacterized RDD family membrane protein YckC
MAARVETRVSTGSKKNEIEIINFDAERFRAPFILRCGAILIDYILLITVLSGSVLLSRFMGQSGSKLLNNPINNAAWLVVLLIAITNFVILPVFSGKTVGKFFTGLQVVQNDGRNLTFMSAMIRHLVGYPLTSLTGGLGFLLSIFNAKGKALHDYLSGTVVVYATRKPKAIAGKQLK